MDVSNLLIRITQLNFVVLSVAAETILNWLPNSQRKRIYVLNLELKSVVNLVYYIIFVFFRVVPFGF